MRIKVKFTTTKQQKNVIGSFLKWKKRL